jgi:Insertion element 4 transposase N-terminal/Transposase DDE domain
MGYTIREMTAERNFCQELTIEALHRVVPPEMITAVLPQTETRPQRVRALTAQVTIWVLIAMNLYTHLALGHVLRKVAQGLRFIWPDPTYRVPGASAFVYRRYQLGAQPLVALYDRLARPLATPHTPGAFRFGLRLMAIDGTVEEVPDTLANAAAFGRQHGSRGDSAFPQVQGVYLVECGTHAIVDATFWPYGTSERAGAAALLRAVTAEMLVMWDRGFHEYDLLAAVRQRGAHVLGRLPAHVKPEWGASLPDGSTLAYLRPSDPKRRTQGERLLVRVIEYTLTDPALPGYGAVHRLVTTLLDPRVAPAVELVCLYHERWESEVVIDEIDTHQRLAGRPLRSQKPEGVLQELYALLIAHFALRVLMHEAALQADLDPDRLSFVHAVRVLRDAIPEFQMVAPAERPRLYQRLLQDIAAGRLPARRLRSNPRVVKRKMSNFRLKRPEHRHWPQPTRPFREAVLLI